MELRNHKPLNWGLGLRPQHYSALIRQNQLPVIEIIADNLMGHKGGPALAHTDVIISQEARCDLTGTRTVVDWHAKGEIKKKRLPPAAV